jgi:hypothetical protein
VAEATASSPLGPAGQATSSRESQCAAFMVSPVEAWKWKGPL